MSISEKILLLNKATLESLNETSRLEIVKKFTTVSLNMLGADFGFAWWRNKPEGKYQLAYKSTNVPYQPKPPRKKGGNYQAQKSRNPFFVSNTATQSYPKEYDVRPYMKSYVIIPIIFQSKFYGNIICCFKRRKRFTFEEKSLCGALGNAMAQALTINQLNSSLYDIKHTLDNTPQPKIIFDPKSSRITYYNKSVLEKTALKPSRGSSNSITEIIHPSSLPLFQKRLKHIVENKIPSSVFEISISDRSRKRTLYEILLQYISLPMQEPHVLAIFTDLKEKKKSERRIRQAAFHDALTGLTNRFLFTRKLKGLIQRSKKTKRAFAIIFVDLDRFKFINDTIGHIMGDELLKKVALNLKKSVKKSDTVSRVGGDEFVILLSNIKSSQAAGQVAKRIQKIFQLPISVNDQEIYVNISMGISTFPKDGKDTENLLKNADNALYQAKEHGGSAYRHYESGMVIPKRGYLEMETDLRNAINNHELRLHYQPIIDLSNGKIHSVEALLRWQHPRLGLISPAGFIPYAEESGLILQLGEWVFSQACQDMDRMRQTGINLKIGINVSARELLQIDIIKNMERILRKYKISPKNFILELTETFLIKNMPNCIQILRKAQQLGFQTTIDDFGTGFTSFNYLRSLPVNFIKADQLFVSGVLNNQQDAAILQAIITIAHHLGIKVVAEGVEKYDQELFLKNHGCDLAQGNYYNHAVSFENLLNILRNQMQVPLTKKV